MNFLCIQTIPSSSNEIQPSNESSVLEETFASERREECESGQNIENGTNTGWQCSHCFCYC